MPKTVAQIIAEAALAAVNAAKQNQSKEPYEGNSRAGSSSMQMQRDQRWSQYVKQKAQSSRQSGGQYTRGDDWMSGKSAAEREWIANHPGAASGAGGGQSVVKEPAKKLDWSLSNYGPPAQQAASIAADSERANREKLKSSMRDLYSTRKGETGPQSFDDSSPIDQMYRDMAGDKNIDYTIVRPDVIRDVSKRDSTVGKSLAQKYLNDFDNSITDISRDDHDALFDLAYPDGVRYRDGKLVDKNDSWIVSSSRGTFEQGMLSNAMPALQALNAISNTSHNITTELGYARQRQRISGLENKIDPNLATLDDVAKVDPELFDVSKLPPYYRMQVDPTSVAASQYKQVSEQIPDGRGGYTWRNRIVEVKNEFAPETDPAKDMIYRKIVERTKANLDFVHRASEAYTPSMWLNEVLSVPSKVSETVFSGLEGRPYNPKYGDTSIAAASTSDGDKLIQRVKQIEAMIGQPLDPSVIAEMPKGLTKDVQDQLIQTARAAGSSPGKEYFSEGLDWATMSRSLDLLGVPKSRQEEMAVQLGYTIKDRKVVEQRTITGTAGSIVTGTYTTFSVDNPDRRVSYDDVANAGLSFMDANGEIVEAAAVPDFLFEYAMRDDMSKSRTNGVMDFVGDVLMDVTNYAPFSFVWKPVEKFFEGAIGVGKLVVKGAGGLADLAISAPLKTANKLIGRELIKSIPDHLVTDTVKQLFTETVNSSALKFARRVFVATASVLKPEDMFGDGADDFITFKLPNIAEAARTGDKLELIMKNGISPTAVNNVIETFRSTEKFLADIAVEGAKDGPEEAARRAIVKRANGYLKGSSDEIIEARKVVEQRITEAIETGHYDDLISAAHVIEDVLRSQADDSATAAGTIEITAKLLNEGQMAYGNAKLGVKSLTPSATVDAANRISNRVWGWWTNAVLTLRPGWQVVNYIDNTFRMLTNGDLIDLSGKRGGLLLSSSRAEDILSKRYGLTRAEISDAIRRYYGDDADKLLGILSDTDGRIFDPVATSALNSLKRYAKAMREGGETAVKAKIAKEGEGKYVGSAIVGGAKNLGSELWKTLKSVQPRIEGGAAIKVFAREYSRVFDPLFEQISRELPEGLIPSVADIAKKFDGINWLNPDEKAYFTQRMLEERAGLQTGLQAIAKDMALNPSAYVDAKSAATAVIGNRAMAFRTFIDTAMPKEIPQGDLADALKEFITAHLDGVNWNDDASVGQLMDLTMSQADTLLGVEKVVKTAQKITENPPAMSEFAERELVNSKSVDAEKVTKRANDLVDASRKAEKEITEFSPAIGDDVLASEAKNVKTVRGMYIDTMNIDYNRELEQAYTRLNKKALGYEPSRSGAMRDVLKRRIAQSTDPEEKAFFQLALDKFNKFDETTKLLPTETRMSAWQKAELNLPYRDYMRELETRIGKPLEGYTWESEADVRAYLTKYFNRNGMTFADGTKSNDLIAVERYAQMRLQLQRIVDEGTPVKIKIGDGEWVERALKTEDLYNKNALIDFKYKFGGKEIKFDYKKTLAAKKRPAVSTMEYIDNGYVQSGRTIFKATRGTWSPVIDVNSQTDQLVRLVKHDVANAVEHTPNINKISDEVESLIDVANVRASVAQDASPALDDLTRVMSSASSEPVDMADYVDLVAAQGDNLGEKISVDIFHGERPGVHSGSTGAYLGDWFGTNSKEYASQYGDPLSYRIELGNPYRMDRAEFRRYDRGAATASETKKFRAELEAKGHDGIIVDHGDGTTEYILFKKPESAEAIGGAPLPDVGVPKILRESNIDPNARLNAESLRTQLLGVIKSNNLTITDEEADALYQFMVFTANANDLSSGWKLGTTLSRVNKITGERWGGDAVFQRQNLDTPEFKKFFAGSKVSDQSGSPVVVYHGTTSDFSEFKKGDIGFHFGTQEQANDRLINTRGEIVWDSGKPVLTNVPKTGESVMPFYLSIKNPLELSGDPGDWNNLKNIASIIESDYSGNPEYVEVARLLREADKSVTKEFSGEFARIAPGDSATSNEVSKRLNAKYAEEGRRILSENGFDGIKYINKFEGLESDPHTNYSWIAFDSGQAKSAIANRGSWDKTNPSMLFQEADVPNIRTGWSTDEERAAFMSDAMPRIRTVADEISSAAEGFPATEGKVIDGVPLFNQSGDGFVKGYNQHVFDPNAIESTRSIIGLLQGSDAYTAFEEWSHHLFKMQTGERKAVMYGWAKAPKDEITGELLSHYDVAREIDEITLNPALNAEQIKRLNFLRGVEPTARAADEKLVLAFRKYVTIGIAPNSKMKEVFEQVKQILIRSWQSVKAFARIKISPELRAAFDDMLGADPDFISEQMKPLMKANAYMTERLPIDLSDLRKIAADTSGVDLNAGISAVEVGGRLIVAKPNIRPNVSDSMRRDVNTVIARLEKLGEMYSDGQGILTGDYDEAVQKFALSAQKRAGELRELLDYAEKNNLNPAAAWRSGEFPSIAGKYPKLVKDQRALAELESQRAKIANLSEFGTRTMVDAKTSAKITANKSEKLMTLIEKGDIDNLMKAADRAMTLAGGKSNEAQESIRAAIIAVQDRILKGEDTYYDALTGKAVSAEQLMALRTYVGNEEMYRALSPGIDQAYLSAGVKRTDTGLDFSEFDIKKFKIERPATKEDALTGIDDQIDRLYSSIVSTKIEGYEYAPMPIWGERIRNGDWESLVEELEGTSVGKSIYNEIKTDMTVKQLQTLVNSKIASGPKRLEFWKTIENYLPHDRAAEVAEILDVAKAKLGERPSLVKVIRNLQGDLKKLVEEGDGVIPNFDGIAGKIDEALLIPGRDVPTGVLAQDAQAKAVSDLIPQWFEAMKNAARSGSAPDMSMLQLLSKDEQKQVMDWLSGVGKKVADASHIAKERAGQHVNDVLMDYNTTLGIDAFLTRGPTIQSGRLEGLEPMRILGGFVPFAKFPRMNMLYIIEQLKHRPQMVQWYQEYQDNINAERRAAGLSEQALPSIPVEIGDTSVEFNPMALLSGKMAVNAFTGYIPDYLSPSEKFFAQVKNLGFSVSPGMQAALMATGFIRPESASYFSIIPQGQLTSLVPGLPQAIEERSPLIASLLGVTSPGDSRGIIKQLGYNALSDIENASEWNKKQIAKEYIQAMENQSGPKWDTAASDYYDNQGGPRVVGYLTGSYPRTKTEQEKQYQEYKQDLATLRNTLDGMGALDDETRTRLEMMISATPESDAQSIINTASPRDADGNVVLPTEAAQKKAQDLVSNKAKYDEERAKILAEYFVKHQVKVGLSQFDADWDAVTIRLNQLEQDYYGRLPESSYKPKTQADANARIRANFMSMLSNSKPAYTGDYDKWKLDVEAWRRNLPEIAGNVWKSIGPVLKALGQPEEMPDYLKSSASPVEMDKFDARFYTLDRALGEVWSKNYYDGYWAAVKGKVGKERLLAEREYYQSHPLPTDKELYNWLEKDIFKGRFTKTDVSMRVKELGGVASVKDKLLQGKDFKAIQGDELSDLLARIPPGREFFKFKDSLSPEMQRFLDAYTVDNYKPLTDDKKWSDFYNTLQPLLEKRYANPSDSLVREWISAEQLDKQLKTDRERRWPGIGELITAYGPMSTTERREYRAEHPEISLYYDWLYNEFAPGNPLWSKYYSSNSTTSSDSGSAATYGKSYGSRYGGGGRRYSNSYGSSYRKYTDEKPYENVEQRGKWIEFKSLAGDVLWGDLNNYWDAGGVLSASATGLLQQLYAKYQFGAKSYEDWLDNVLPALRSAMLPGHNWFSDPNYFNFQYQQNPFFSDQKYWFSGVTRKQ